MWLWVERAASHILRPGPDAHLLRKCAAVFVWTPGYQLLAALIFFAWSFGLCSLMFFGLSKAGLFRVAATTERKGMDAHHHGGSAYMDEDWGGGDVGGREMVAVHHPALPASMGGKASGAGRPAAVVDLGRAAAGGGGGGSGRVVNLPRGVSRRRSSALPTGAF